MLVESLSDYGVVALALGLAGATTGLARTFIAHRTRLREEREASVRAAARMTGLMGLAEARHVTVRITERDRDGHRVVELGGPKHPAPAADEEAA